MRREGRMRTICKVFCVEIRMAQSHSHVLLFLSFYLSQHKHDIQTDPVFRQRFLTMCAPLGIDPLMTSKKGFLAFLNMGDYYHELAVKVAEVCLASRSQNGGIMSISQVQCRLQQRTTKLGNATTTSSSNNKNGNNKNKVSVADIVVAVQKLATLGGGFRLVEVGRSTTMIVSVPMELDQDHMTVMNVATTKQTATRGITSQCVQDHTDWNQERVERVLEMLLQQGMAWMDSHDGKTFYWFPSVWQEQQQSEMMAVAVESDV